MVIGMKEDWILGGVLKLGSKLLKKVTKICYVGLPESSCFHSFVA